MDDNDVPFQACVAQHFYPLAFSRFPFLSVKILKPLLDLESKSVLRFQQSSLLAVYSFGLVSFMFTIEMIRLVMEPMSRIVGANVLALSVN